MDPRTLEALEFDRVRRLIDPFIRTPGGRRALYALEPAGDAATVASRKEVAAESMRRHIEEGRVGPGPLPDPEPVLEQLEPEGSVLDPLEIALLVGVIEAGDALRRDLAVGHERYPRLWQRAGSIPDLRDVTGPIAGRISSEGRIEDAASPALASARRRIADLESRLQRDLQAILDRGDDQGLLQDAYVTIRNGRFVIPVRAEARAAMPGLVHGTSSTGQTVFVEPLQTLELNNDLVTAREAEEAEIRRILTDWSGRLRSRLGQVRASCSLLSELDLLGSIAAFGVAGGYAVASSSDGAGARLQLVEARHPVLEAGLAARGERAVPLSIELAGTGGALVLSGPNAGGKTVALKTIGLLCLMNQAGMPLPAREAVLPVYRRVLADIGDHQSILESLSTFSARMVRVAWMYGALKPPALVLLDEVGAGTDPEEAGALAVAIVDHFRESGASVVATTHHEVLKVYAETAPGAVNAAMEVDEATMRPTYQINIGFSGRSGGIDLASRVGIPQEVVRDARERLSPGHEDTQRYRARLESLVQEKEQELEEARRERAGEAQRVAALRESMERRLAEQEQASRAAIREALAAIERAREEFLAGVKDRAIALQLKAESRRRARDLERRLEEAFGSPAVAAGTGELRKGTRVRVTAGIGAGEIGAVETLDGRGGAIILLRGKRIALPVADLSPVDEAPPSPAPRRPAPPAGVRLERASDADVPEEINLIGSRIEEALDRLDKYLDHAYLAGHPRVRIVHGHGTGRLRAAVGKMLDAHPHVATHAAADERSGGAGVTVAALRD